MAEIRGEKVNFSKRDIVPLHGLPSARAETPLIVHCPVPGSLMRGLLKIFTALFILAFLAIGGIIVAIETGSVDALLSSQAQQALAKTIGNRYDARIGSSVIRFSSGFRLALEARDVDLVEKASGNHVSRTAAIRMALDPFALLLGRISVDSIEADTVELDTGLLPAGKPVDPNAIRVDAIPAGLESVFSNLDGLLQTFQHTGTEQVSVSGLYVRLPATPDGEPLDLTMDNLSMRRTGADTYRLTGDVALNSEAAELSLSINAAGGHVSGFDANLDGLDLAPLLIKRDQQGEIHQGLDVKAGAHISAKRAVSEQPLSLSVNVGVGNGTLYIGGDAQPLTNGTVQARYDFEKHSIDIAGSKLVLARTVLPLSGTIRDNDTVNGFDLALRIDDGVASAEASGEQAVPFNVNATGQFLKAEKLLSVPSLYVSGPLGDMAGSLKVQFGQEGSPAISFGGQIPKMQSSAVKQLWPFWMARKVRPWVVENIFGGTVTNGSIAVFIPPGRMCGPGCPLELGASELQIRFDIDQTRLNIAGDIPPLRDVSAHFDLVGERVEVKVAKATSYFPSNRSLTIDRGNFLIRSVYDKPLMADLDLSVSGSADTVAELASFRPINALKDTQFSPNDFKGQVKADAKATIGLLSSQAPPPPVWSASLALDGVSLTRPLAGRSVAALNGKLDVNNDVLQLKGKGRVDDLAMDIALTEPTRKGGKAPRERVLKATLDDTQLKKFAPGLSGIIGGTAAVEITGNDDARQDVKLDLKQASLTVPGIGWNKGVGVAADATFVLQTGDGRTNISNFELKGDGFGASGAIVLGQNGLISADFSRLRLSPSDDYAVAVKAVKGGYAISANGGKIDARPLIMRIRSSAGGGDGGSGGTDKSNVSISANFDRITGFNDETLSNVKSQISIRSGKVRSLDFSGVTDSGQAVVAQTAASGARETINLTSSDAGSLIRFANIYSRIRNGLLNLAFSTTNGDDWSGSVDMRNFSVANEQKLQDIVATPVGEDGRSLNKAVRRNIDVSTEKFQRGFARVVYANGVLHVENGVVRGEQIGATFQGTVKDRNGNMEMTGTFMPAYGLNRLFGELPIIGIILGNGTDRGLLGITFKLSGRSDAPKLAINPLSLIAPGVFRQIFEFQ
jgi:hypothetical protein